MAQINTTTVGFIGTGKTSSKNITALLSDYVDSKKGNVKFVLPLTVYTFTETFEYIYQFALDYDIDLELVTDASTRSNKKFVDILENIQQQNDPIDDVVKGVVGILLLAQEKTLIIAWDDEDESCLNALDAAINHDIKALDLTTGLSELEFNDEPLDNGPQQETSNTTIPLSNETTDSEPAQQAELLVSRIPVDSERIEESASDMADRELGEELDTLVPFHRVLERLVNIEGKLDELLKRYPI